MDLYKFAIMCVCVLGKNPRIWHVPVEDNSWEGRTTIALALSPRTVNFLISVWICQSNI